MMVKGATAEQIRDAADAANVRIYNLTWKGCDRRGLASFTFRLKTYTPDGADHAPFRRFSLYSDRNGNRRTVPGAVCWHGHREFFRALYRLCPDAKVKTAMAVYTSPAQFEATHAATYHDGGTRMGCELGTGATSDCSCR